MNNMKTTLPKSKSITSVDVPLAPASAEATSKAPDKITLNLGSKDEPNSDVKVYNHAAQQEKAWKKIKDESKPKVQVDALTKLYEHNTDNPDHPVKTVCVVDSTGAACNVTLKDTYGAANHDPVKVTAGLRELGKTDPNKFVAEKVVIGFDTKVFYGEDGSLNTELYTAMMEAIGDVALEHSVPSPFSSTKVVSVKEGFADLRWTAFTEAQQERVSELFPATVSLTPLAPEKTAKA